MTIDLVIAGGTVLDPASGRHERADVAITDGRVTAIGPGLPFADARAVIDASGRFVVPGLVDLHAHVYAGVGDVSLDVEPHHLWRGVTTIVDAGSAGASTFAGFQRYVIDRSEARILAFLNISALGLVAAEFGELVDLRYAQVDRAVEIARHHPDAIVGFKVRMTESVVGPHGLAALARTLEAGVELGLPVMVHIGASAVSMEEILGRLRPGDIVTHAFTGRAPGILDAVGRIRPAVLEARQRGVLFDVGHGRSGFTWAVIEAALADGFVPDTISTDLHRGNVDGPVHDLVSVLSKFLYLGLSLDEVIERATIRPMRAIGRSAEGGSLTLGGPADVLVLGVEEGVTTLSDSLGIERVASSRLVAVTTIRSGRVVHEAGDSLLAVGD